MRALVTPRMIGAHLLALVLVSTAFALAFWQYDAWSARRAAEAIDLTRLSPVALAEVMGPDDPFPGTKIGQPVEVRGTWIPSGSVLVSGRELDGVQGYWVVTPLAVDGRRSAIPVVRGWSAEPGGVPAAPAGPVSLTGYLQPSEGRTISDDDPTDDVLPQLRTADLLQRVDTDLFGAYVVEDGDRSGTAVNAAASGLETATLAQLPDAGTFTAVRNLLYALEWVVFGGFAGFVWWRFVRDELEARRRDEDGPEDGPGDDEGHEDGKDDEDGDPEPEPADPTLTRAK